MIQEENLNMTDDFIQHLLENEIAFCGAPLSSAKFKLQKHNMNNSRLLALPESYWNFLSQINGVFLDGAEIYGIKPEERLLKDLEAMNKNHTSSEWIILGENETDQFVYDTDDEKFKVMDKKDLFVWKQSSSLETILTYFLKNSADN